MLFVANTNLSYNIAFEHFYFLALIHLYPLRIVVGWLLAETQH